MFLLGHPSVTMSLNFSGFLISQSFLVLRRMSFWFGSSVDPLNGAYLAAEPVAKLNIALLPQHKEITLTSWKSLKYQCKDSPTYVCLIFLQLLLWGWQVSFCIPQWKCCKENIELFSSCVCLGKNIFFYLQHRQIFGIVVSFLLI